MKPSVFVDVLEAGDGQLMTTLPSSALLFLVTYSGPTCFHVYFVRTEGKDAKQFCVHLSEESLRHFHHDVVTTADIPDVVQRCRLPAVYDEDKALVHSGLCTSVRHVIHVVDAAEPSKNLKEILGFRQGSLRMCSEVSGWTKICEVELPSSVTTLITMLRSSRSKDSSRVELPADLVRMETHFGKPPRIHNDDKLKRAVLKDWRCLAADPATRDAVLQRSRLLPSGLCLWLEVPLFHSTRVFEMEVGAHDLKDFMVTAAGDGSGHGEVCQGDVNNQGDSCLLHLDKDFVNLCLKSGAEENCGKCPSNDGRNCDQQSSNGSVGRDDVEVQWTGGGDAGTVLDMKTLLEKRTYVDVRPMHLFLEGLEMTVADLLLFVYVYHLIAILDFDVAGLRELVPKTMEWMKRLAELDLVLTAGRRCSLDMSRLCQALTEGASEGNQGRSDSGLAPCHPLSKFRYALSTMETVTEDEMELSRRCRSKYRAIKPEVQQALEKIEVGDIKPTVGSHPRGTDVHLAWDAIPRNVHPQSGGVPGERTQRKCQQLENLATAVEAIAKPKDIIVDFCSGGTEEPPISISANVVKGEGHLGILIAHLLPQCEVYLVENKEESLMVARKRIDKLQLKNITMIQCNLEYFHGAFDIGVCLHACGVATDMVLQKCLHKQAGFVICPCCYGKVQMTHLISYPQSHTFQQAGLGYKDLLTLGHAADQTELNIALQKQGQLCMNLVDTDRAELAREQDYTVTLCSLQPLSCTPKNNLLVGIPAHRSMVHS